ncbi:Ger(x)C family spore germination protein [Fredinandcohnia humi]
MNKFLLIFLLLFTLTGCVGQTIVEDVNLLSGLGYDLEDDKVRVTTLVPRYQPDKKTSNITFSVLGKFEDDTIKKVNAQSEKPFVSGTLEVVLIENQLAEGGVLRLIDQVRRHPVIGSRVYLAIVDGKAKDVLETNQAPLETGRVISGLIEQNVKFGMLPKTNLHIFRSVYQDEGMDPLLPIIEKKEDKIILKGIALFEGDSYKASIENTEDTFVFKLLMGEKDYRDSLILHLEDTNDFVRIEKAYSKRAYTISEQMKTPKITITIKTVAYLTEYSGEEITKKLKPKIEKDVAKEIKTRAEKLIAEFQKQQIDPLGIGLEVRSRTRNWDLKKWDELYPNAQITVKPEVTVMHYGVFE